ncbi:MAG: ribosome small subunit-dependent GTPase A [Cyanobacteria bacterium]|nr:ribosome small subunit-dependent GTPase A [Cyanobacteriota bacterium]
MALEANYCRVVLDQPGPGGVRQLLCTRRTRLGKSGQHICVGDRVGVDGIDWPAGRGAVAALEPRDGLLERPAVANVRRVVVVVALAEPAIDPLQLTRFLLTAERTGCAVQLVFSKADLVAEAEVRGWCERVAAWGYPALAVSNQLGCGDLTALRQTLSLPGIAVVCGPSGVGKSSLLNALAPDLGLRVGSVSGRLRRGRHTTRHVELFALTSPQAGVEPSLVADSPGFNRPDLPPDPTLLAGLFPELRSRLEQGGCRYSNCRHLGESGCRVGVDWDRHGFYRQCLAEIEAQWQARSSRGKEAGVRQRGDRLEPLLDPQLRRRSRSSTRQHDLDEARSDQEPGADPPPGQSGADELSQGEG